MQSKCDEGGNKKLRLVKKQEAKGFYVIQKLKHP